VCQTPCASKIYAAVSVPRLTGGSTMTRPFQVGGAKREVSRVHVCPLVAAFS
jgi:hypothetical protein